LLTTLLFLEIFQIKNQQSLVDLVVAMVAIPTLILLALTLETKMREDWMEKLETRWAVLGIGIGLLCASLVTCGYVTHRMGVCLWAGPQEDDTYPTNLTRVNLKKQKKYEFINVFLQMSGNKKPLFLVSFITSNLLFAKDCSVWLINFVNLSQIKLNLLDAVHL
jgi:hypothetical protein